MFPASQTLGRYIATTSNNDSDITIPNEVGRFQVNLEGGATNLALLGVLAVLFEEDDTADDAIAAGYDAFPIAVSRELNNYVNANGNKLTEESVLEIRATTNETKQALAKLFGVSRSLISLVQRRRAWRHL